LGNPDTCAIGRKSAKLFAKNGLSLEDVLQNVEFQSVTVNDLGNQIKLRQRVCKMLKRGWTCLNSEEAFHDTFLFTSTGKDESENKCPIAGCTLETIPGDYMFFTTCCKTRIHFECIHARTANTLRGCEVKCPSCGMNKFW